MKCVVMGDFFFGKIVTRRRPYVFFILRNRLTVVPLNVAKDDGVGVYENMRNRKRTDGGGGGATVGEKI